MRSVLNFERFDFMEIRILDRFIVKCFTFISKHLDMEYRDQNYSIYYIIYISVTIKQKKRAKKQA